MRKTRAQVWLYSLVEPTEIFRRSHLPPQGSNSRASAAADNLFPPSSEVLLSSFVPNPRKIAQIIRFISSPSSDAVGATGISVEAWDHQSQLKPTPQGVGLAHQH